MARPCRNNISHPSTCLKAHNQTDGLVFVEKRIQCLFLQENSLGQDV